MAQNISQVCHPTKIKSKFSPFSGVWYADFLQFLKLTYYVPISGLHLSFLWCELPLFQILIWLSSFLPWFRSLLNIYSLERFTVNILPKIAVPDPYSTHPFRLYFSFALLAQCHVLHYVLCSCLLSASNHWDVSSMTAGTLSLLFNYVSLVARQVLIKWMFLRTTMSANWLK